DPGHAVLVLSLVTTGNPQRAIGNVVDHEWQLAGAIVRRRRGSPLELLAVWPLPGAGLRPLIGDSGRANAFQFVVDILRADCEIDQPWPVEEPVPAMIVRLLRFLKGDQLQIGAILKGDERIVGTVWVLTTRGHLESELPVA